MSVELGADFEPVTVSDSSVLELVTVDGGYPTGKRLVVLLAAAHPGAAFLSASTDFACLHVPTPCALPQQEWTLSVTVTGG